MKWKEATTKQGFEVFGKDKEPLMISSLMEIGKGESFTTKCGNILMKNSRGDIYLRGNFSHKTFE
jgi:hypothetical protein